MNEYFFVDTNLLVYARDSNYSEKQKRALNWLDFLWRTRRGKISVQVISEFIVTVHSKLKSIRKPADFEQDILDLLLWHPSSITTSTIKLALKAKIETNFSWWDCLVLSSASEQECTYLLSEDMQNNFVYKKVKIINPFNLSPEEV